MTSFDIASFISIAVLIFSIAFAIYKIRKPYRSARFVTPARILAVGVFVAGLVMFFPHYWDTLQAKNIGVHAWETFWASAHHSVRLFVIDTAYDDVSSFAQNDLYAILGTVLYITAPLMTAGVILSFFRNTVSYLKCVARRTRDAYIFSELSDRSLALATDIKKNHKTAVLIFTDVFEENNEENYELCERAKTLGAICFRKDIASLGLGFFSRTSHLHFFAIGEDQVENVRQAFELSKEDGIYAKRKNTLLYVFATDVQSELLLSNLPETSIRLRRINDIRALVWNDLYKNGYRIFEDAAPAEEGDDRAVINALVVGTGGHGTEMIKALTWYCQMEGYRIEIHAFDRDEMAEERFKLLAPELMDPRNNGVYVKGEAQYKITFHSGFSVNTARFTEELLKVGSPTYIFVSTGDDARNVHTAVLLRRFFRQKHLGNPAIHAIVYDSKNKKTLDGAHNWKNQPYDIRFVGDLEEMYSESVILREALEEEALATHTSYGGSEEDFYRYEYNYRSSMASALHRDLRRKLHIADFDKTADELTVEERDLLERIEHNRWNAYMRSEGYVYSGSKTSDSRDDLANMHHNLVPFDELSEEDKRKDSIVGVRK